MSRNTTIIRQTATRNIAPHLRPPNVMKRLEVKGRHYNYPNKGFLLYLSCQGFVFKPARLNFVTLGNVFFFCVCFFFCIFFFRCCSARCRKFIAFSTTSSRFYMKTTQQKTLRNAIRIQNRKLEEFRDVCRKLLSSCRSTDVIR